MSLRRSGEMRTSLARRASMSSSTSSFLRARRTVVSSLHLFSRPPLIAVVHAPPLPGSHRYEGSWKKILDRVAGDVDAYVQGGVDGLVLENFGDAPFFPGRVPHVTIAHMTALAGLIREKTSLPLGLNVLRNDGEAACAIAHAVGAQFIRVNVLCGARLTDQGIISGIAHDLLRMRRSLHADRILIFADVDVKHSAPLANRDLKDEVEEIFERGGADAVIVTGRASGTPADLAHIECAKRAAGGKPVFVGSGVTLENIQDVLERADGMIVGTSLKRDGRIEKEVDIARVTALRHACDVTLARLNSQ